MSLGPLLLSRTWTLWMLTMAAAIVAAYFIRGRRRRLPVPDLALWREVLLQQASRGGWRRLRDLLRLVLSLLTLVFLTLAASDPSFPAYVPKPRHVVVVLDLSASMQARAPATGESTWENALGAVERLRFGLSQSDRLSLIAAGREVQLLSSPGTPVDELMLELHRSRPRAPKAELVEAVRFARALREPEALFCLYVLCDPAGARSLSPVSWGAEEQLVVVPPCGGNLALTDLHWYREGVTDFGTVLCRLANFSDAARQVEVRLLFDGAEKENRSVALQGGQQRYVPLRLEAPRSGFAAVELVGDDLLALDDRVYFPISRPDRPAVTVVTSDRVSPFLHALLSAVRDDIDSENSGLLAPEKAREFLARPFPGIVLIDGASLEYPLPDGAYLLLGCERTSLPVDIGELVEEPIPSVWAERLEVMKYVNLAELQLRRAYLVHPRPGQQPLLWSDRGVLGLLGERGKLRYLYLGFRPEDSNLPLLVAFPLFFKNAIQWLSRPPEPLLRPSYRYADSIAVTLPPDSPGAVLERYAAEGESGGSGGDSGSGARWVNHPMTARGLMEMSLRPGLYRLRVGEEVAWSAVNFLSEKESDLRGVEPTGSVPALPQTQSVLRVGEKVWKPLLGLGVFTLLLEFLLFGRPGAKKGKRG